MNTELPQISDGVWNALLLLGGSVRLIGGGTAILVAARLAGILFVGPFLGRPVLTWPIRIGLVAFLTAVVTPQLSMEELNIPLLDLISHSAVSNGLPTDFASTSNNVKRALPIDFLFAVAYNAVAGASIGVGVAVFLSGLRMAGEWFDRHSGLGMGNVLDPEFLGGGSGPGEIVCLFCIVTLLVLQPINGHLLVTRLILDSFRALPVELSQWPLPLMELPVEIVRQSLILGLRISMPFVVAMSLLDLTLSYAHRSSRWQLMPLAAVVRAGASIMILAATLPGIQEAVGSTLQEALLVTSEATSNVDLKTP